MDNNSLVSVIIPIYNSEKYLTKCIESVLSQTHSNLELILINDGSLDGSAKMCDYYATKDKRIRYFYQNNSGQSIARNNGILYSKGDFIYFMDSDDYLNIDTLEVMVKYVKNHDVLITGYNIINEHNNKVRTVMYNDSIFDISSFLCNFGEILNSGTFHYIWNKLYKAEYIRDKIYFNPSMKIGEDLIFNLQYFSNVEKIKTINNPTYNHINNNEYSITKTYDPQLFNKRKKNA